MEKYPEFDPQDLTQGTETVDFDLSKEIRAFLNQHVEEEKEEKKRNISQYAASITAILGVIFFFPVALNAIMALFASNYGNYIQISAQNLADSFTLSEILLLVAIGFMGIAIIAGLIRRVTRFVLANILAVGIGLGFYIYLSQRDLLFYFQNYGQVPGVLQISLIDLAIFLSVNLIAFMGASIPIILALWHIIKNNTHH